MTIDDVAAAMRARFSAPETPTAVTISAEEWNALAGVIYLRDHLAAVIADPSPEMVAKAQRHLEQSGASRRTPRPVKETDRA